MIKRGSGVAVAAALVCGISLVQVAPSAATAATADHSILVGDQATDKIYRLNPATSAWDSWTWAPTTALGYTSPTETGGFNGGNDFRVRTTTSGLQRLVVADGAGLATVATYPAGERVWAVRVPAADNLHAVELLPDGNVAIAATGTAAGTGGDYVRVYSTSNGATATFPLETAHAVLWDPGIRRLWVAGSPNDGTAEESQVLKALEVTGPATAPGLREDPARTQVISLAAGTGGDDVHDVAADHTDPDKLWITTNRYVYTYDKVTRQLARAAAGIDRGAVKSISSQPSGQLIQTQADRYRTPPGACGTVNGWCTETVDFVNPATSVTRAGAQFYKARTASPHYGVEDTAQRGRVFDTVGGTTTRIDGNAATGQTAATAGPDGRQHVLTLIPGSGLWSRSRSATGGWETTATRVDHSTQITDAAIAADPDGDLHAFTLIPGSGVWHRVRPLNQAWTGTAEKVDSGTDVTSIAAVVHPGTKRLHLVLAGSGGVRDRVATATGDWTAAATTVDTNATVADVAAAALPNGSLHLFTVTAWGTVYHRTGTDSGWSAGASVVPGGGENPATGQVRGLAAAGWPTTQLDLVTLRAGLGLWKQTWTGASWPAAASLDPTPGAIQVYATRLTDNTLHTGTIVEISPP
ncbi:DUF6528 family protein [Actinoplanes xinjiangensis]|uniref:DUF6528 family protein n=1 Tax=Actinoplanes xinjiangensis TaxID=512350 RepID=UPI003427B43A